jgi:hypothetical protein
MPDLFLPPFRAVVAEEAAWVEDAGGQRFAYTYLRDDPIVGTDRSGRVSRALAERTVRWIANAMNEAVEKRGV